MADNVEVVTGQQQEQDGRQSQIEEPGKLLRIAVMLREMQEEARRAPTDQGGRERLRRVHDQAVAQLCEALSGDLREELNTLALPFDDEEPSESEILIAQAQLIGWLEGLFQGIQAAIVNQQMQARQQLEQMRQRQLPGGRIVPGQPGQTGQQSEGMTPPTGQYL
ncbi:MAG: DUF2587 domain-containing protein [Nitriliruptorales bacterium]|nr:DUF2587 domain-containing protein [Nitriliruptorales bacterium]